MADPRMVGHGLRRRMGAPKNHLQMAADEAGRQMAAKEAKKPVQGTLFDKPKTTYKIDTNDFTSKKITSWGRPGYGGS